MHAMKDDKGQLDLARSLVASLEAGDSERAEELTARLCLRRDNLVVREVGRLARELHSAINEFMFDDRVIQLVHSEIPDAAERLNYVITMTEQAANATLNAVERGLPLAEDLRAESGRLAAEWDRFQARELKVEDFRALSRDVVDFLATTAQAGQQLHDQLSEVLMAQGFQDLTGQIIRRVIGLVHDVEDKLLEVLVLAEDQGLDTEAKPAARVDTLQPQGPKVPGVDRGEHLNSQDDVDDLLSNLGF